MSTAIGLFHEFMNQYKACLYLYIWMHFSLWFQIWSPKSRILTFLNNLLNFWRVVCTRLPRGKHYKLSALYFSRILSFDFFSSEKDTECFVRNNVPETDHADHTRHLTSIQCLLWCFLTRKLQVVLLFLFDWIWWNLSWSRSSFDLESQGNKRGSMRYIRGLISYGRDQLLPVGCMKKFWSKDYIWNLNWFSALYVPHHHYDYHIYSSCKK